jgi:SH3-like domain-containing protein
MGTSPSTTHKGHSKDGDRDVSALKQSQGQTIAVAEQTCEGTAYVGPVDAAAVTLRREPSHEAAVVATVSAQEPTVVTVAGAQSPWLYVTPGPEAPGGLAAPGWIQGSRLAIQVRSADGSDLPVPLYETPTADAAPIGEIATGTEVPLWDCVGAWLQVQSPGDAPGWLAPQHQCSNPLSTCP